MIHRQPLKDAINETVPRLILVKIGSEKLCSQSVTLLTAKGVFTFIMKELHHQKLQFTEKLTNRIQTFNRNTALIGLFHYFNTSKYEKYMTTLGLLLSSEKNFGEKGKKYLHEIFVQRI